jgi:uncharacterized protein YjbJ (UPF0337 family)
MNWDIIEGKWRQLKADVRVKWSKLTDDDLNLIDGKREKLVGVLQERYGHKREQVERDVDSWVETKRDAGRPQAH